MTIGERIKFKRKERGITQQELAEYIDKSLRSVQKYEKGNTTPSIKILTKIAEVLNISLNALLTNEDKTTTLVEDILNFWVVSAHIHEISPESMDTYFELLFEVKKPKDNIFTEEELTFILAKIIETNINEYIKIFKNNQNVILSFNHNNLNFLNATFQEYYNPHEDMRNTIIVPNYKHITYNSATMIHSLQMLFEYIQNTSNQEAFKLLNYNFNLNPQLTNEIIKCIEEKIITYALANGDIKINLNSKKE